MQRRHPRPVSEALGEEAMDPNPVKHLAVLLARVREAIEPVLCEAGFTYEGRNKVRGIRAPQHRWIHYCRGQEVVSLDLDDWQAKLSLTAVDERGAMHEVALISLQGVGTPDELVERAAQFVQSVQQSPYFKANGHAEQIAAPNRGRRAE
jgi:hypothetical protein